MKFVSQRAIFCHFFKWDGSNVYKGVLQPQKYPLRKCKRLYIEKMIICQRKSYRYSVSSNSVFLPLRRCGHIVQFLKSLNHSWKFFTQKSYIQFKKNHKSLNMLRLRSVSSLIYYIEYYCCF